MFNAPGDQPDHAERAIECALELDEFCRRYAAGQRALGVDLGDTRIGINTGETVVGNFGGPTRFDYTAHGDAINTAARLEGVNKYFDTQVLRERDHACALRLSAPSTDWPARPEGQVGRPRGVRAAHRLAHAGTGDRRVREGVSAGRILRSDRRKVFAELTERYPDDGLIAFYAIRLEAGMTGVTIRLSEK